MINFFIYIFILFTYLFAQEQIGEGLYGDDLIVFLQNNYKTSSTQSYNNARDILYSQIDIDNNDDVFCIYTNYSVNLPANVDPSNHLYENGMNCEHLWPQSMYEVIINNNMKADMHHLRPCKENANSYRNNKAFGNSVDSQTDNWLWLTYNLTSIPSSNISEYSESENSIFEPREDAKGDIARAMFYFFTIYQEEANDGFFNSQKEILYDWHSIDPIENSEIERTWAIADYQNDIPNPFIIDSTLIYRAYFYGGDDGNIGDVTQDGVVNVVDVVLIINYILGTQVLNSAQLQIADINADDSINIVDIVTLVNLIIGA